MGVMTIGGLAMCPDRKRVHRTKITIGENNGTTTTEAYIESETGLKLATADELKAINANLNAFTYDTIDTKQLADLKKALGYTEPTKP